MEVQNQPEEQKQIQQSNFDQTKQPQIKDESNNNNCLQHKQFPIEYFCLELDCENNDMETCAKCFLTTHKGHKYEDQDIFMQILNQIKDDRKCILMDITSRENFKNRVKDKIADIKNDMNLFLDSVAQNIGNQIDSFPKHVSDEKIIEFNHFCESLQNNNTLDKSFQKFALTLYSQQDDLKTELREEQNVSKTIDSFLTHKIKQVQSYIDNFKQNIKQQILDQNVQQFQQQQFFPFKSSIKKFQKKVISELSGHTNWVNTILKISDSEIATGSNDTSVKIWDLAKNQCIKTLMGHQKSIYCLQMIDLQESKIASGSLDYTVIIWNYKTGQALNQLQCHKKSVYTLCAFKPYQLVSGSADKSLAIWDVNKGQLIQHIVDAHDKDIWCILKLEENIIATGSSDKKIKIWDFTQKFTEIGCLQGHTDDVLCLLKINETTIASGSSQNERAIRIWNYKTGVCLRVLKGHDRPVWCLVRLNEKEIISACYGSSMKMWNIDQDECIETINLQENIICQIIMFDSNTLISGDVQSKILIWK